MKSQEKLIGSLVLLFVFLILLTQAIFIVREGEKAIILRFQEIYKDKNGQSIVFSPGLHFKIPVIDSVYPMTVKIQTAESKQKNMITKGDSDGHKDSDEINKKIHDATKFLLVDFYVKYRIVDPGLFYQRAKTINYFNDVVLSRAETEIRQVISDSEFSDVIRGGSGGTRSNLSQGVLKKLSNDIITDFGVQVIDVRFKKVDLAQSVADSVYQRMIAVQKKNSTEIRSRGTKESDIIKARAKQLAEVRFQQHLRKANEIIAEGKQKAAFIYNDAYSKDPDFYKFHRSLKSYAKSIQDNDLLVMTPKEYSYLQQFIHFKPTQKTH